MKNPLTSIILPTYNNSSYLPNSIESILAQSYENWELFIINDGSIDDTENVIKNYTEKDPRIIYLKNEKNLGIQKSLNEGFKRATGEYIAHIDDDDEWIDKDKLKKQIEFLENNPEYVLVGTGVIVVDENKKELLRYLLPETDQQIRKVLLYKNCFTHSSVLFKKEVIDKFGGYDEAEESKHIEDYDLWMKIGLSGKMHNLPEHMTVFTMRSGSISSNHKIEQFKKNIKLCKKYKNKYPNYLFALTANHLKLIFYAFFTKIPFKNLKNKIFKFYKEF